MGKWSHLKGTLPAAPAGASAENTPERIARVGAFKDDYRRRLEGSKELMAKHYASLRDTKESLEDFVSYLNEKIDALQSLMVEAFENDGITMFKGVDGQSFIIKDEPYASVADIVAFNEYIDKTGQQDLRKVQWQTVNAITKAALESGQEPPPGVKVAMKSTIQRRKK